MYLHAFSGIVLRLFLEPLHLEGDAKVGIEINPFFTAASGEFLATMMEVWQPGLLGGDVRCFRQVVTQVKAYKEKKKSKYDCLLLTKKAEYFTSHQKFYQHIFEQRVRQSTYKKLNGQIALNRPSW